jgi:GNAT superfamily N-acetyltransferase
MMNLARNIVSQGASEGWVASPGGISFHEARNVIGSSFAGSQDGSKLGEPFTDWFLEDMDFVSDEQRSDTTSFILGIPIYENFGKGGMAFGKKEDEVLTSCAMVVEYDSGETQKGLLSHWAKKCRDTMAVAKMASGGIPDLFTKKEWKARQDHFMKIIQLVDDSTHQWHAQYGPKGKHWHVAHVAVHPDHRGKGAGMALMARLNAASDACGMACYLQCVGDRNKAFYEKMGYALMGSGTLVDPVDYSREITCNFMLRHPIT